MIKVTHKIEYDLPGFGKRLRKLREADSRSYNQLVRQAGISRVHWDRIEKEQCNISLSTLQSLEKVFGRRFLDLD